MAGFIVQFSRTREGVSEGGHKPVFTLFEGLDCSDAREYGRTGGLASSPDMANQNKTRAESEIKRVLHDAFGWALTKDRALFESIFAKDEDFFTFYPDSKSTVRGWSQFEEFLDRWMDPRSVAKGFDIRDLRIVVSRKGNTPWFSAIVDDEGEFDGKPWGTKDVRWTGVLERRGGSWRICQQHMSEPNEKVPQ